MNELDIRKSPETIRFADGGRNENNIYIQDYDGFQFAVIRDGDGKEAEIEAEDIGNLIKALEQVKEYFSEDRGKSNWENAIDTFEKAVFDEFFGVKPKLDWNKHKGGECPVHPLDVIEIINDLGGKGAGALPADRFFWSGIDYYRPLRDSDGVPYCSADGLEPWAEYVATDEDGKIMQYDCKPKPKIELLWWDVVNKAIVDATEAPLKYKNTFQHWTETLRRVYRDPADGNNYRMGT